MSGHLLESSFEKGVARIGQVAIVSADAGFVLRHRDDVDQSNLSEHSPDEARELAKFDDAGNYRPLKTMPNLRHGWRVTARDLAEAARVVDAIYPGRLAVLQEFRSGGLPITSLRELLDRQTGMYRAAARITNAQADELVGKVCQSGSGCLRTVLWPLDGSNSIASLPPEKFDPEFDQTGRGEKCVPLLCQEACNLLVAAAREVVKGKS